MNVKQAIDAAKSYLQEVFGSELMSPPRFVAESDEFARLGLADCA